MDPDHVIQALKIICLNVTVCILAVVGGCVARDWAPKTVPPVPPEMTDAIAQRIWAYQFVTPKVTSSVDEEFMNYITSFTNSVEVHE